MKARDRFFACVFGFLVLLGGAVYLVMVPAFEALKEIDRDLDANNARIATLNKKVKTIPSLREKNSGIEAEIDKLKQTIVERQGLDQVLKDLSAAAARFDAGISTVSLLQDSLSTTPHGRLSHQVPMVMDMEARYLDLGVFVENFDRLPFAAVPTAIRIDGTDPGNGRLSIRLEACVFVWVDNVSMP